MGLRGAAKRSVPSPPIPLPTSPLKGEEFLWRPCPFIQILEYPLVENKFRRLFLERAFGIGEIPGAGLPSASGTQGAAKSLLESSNALAVGPREIDRQPQVLIELAHRLHEALARALAGRRLS